MLSSQTVTIRVPVVPSKITFFGEMSRQHLQRKKTNNCQDALIVSRSIQMEHSTKTKVGNQDLGTTGAIDKLETKDWFG